MNEPGAEERLQGALPELREGMLSEADLEAYGADLLALGTDVRCQVRREGGAPPDRVSLQVALERARAGAAVQIQYEYAGSGWRDTLMATAGGHRLIRMRMIQESS